MLKTILFCLAGLAVLAAGYVYFFLYLPDLSRDQLTQYISDESEFVTLPSGANIHYRDEGNPDGPVLYMFHGGLGSLHNWEGWVPELGDTYRLVSLDFPAHGLTGRVPGDIYMRSIMVRAAKELADHLKLDDMVVAGNSMGGGIALQFALDNPDRVKGLILIGSEGVPNSEEGYDASQFTDEKPLEPDDPGFAKLTMTEQVMIRFFPGREITRGVLDTIVADKDLLTDEFVDYYGTIIRHDGNRQANALMFRQLSEILANPRDLEPRLGEIAVPVLYMHGSDDTTVPENIARKFVDFLPNSELKIYDGVGHMAMIEKPKETAVDVRAFFEKNEMN